MTHAVKLFRLLPALLCAAAHAQDTRHVTEPVLPPSCAVLIASASSPDEAGADDTARLQTAIDRCPAGRALHLAASNEKTAFVAGPLTLKSGVSLVVDAGATLYASPDPARYDLGKQTCGINTPSGHGCKPFISVDDAQGSAIMGEGVIDGQGGHTMSGKTESWWQLARRAQKEDAHQNVPRLIEVNRARDFTLYRITLRNSPNFHVTLNQVDGFTAWGMKIDTPATARNTDGIDPISSRNVTIAYSAIRTGDDNVAIKGGKLGAVENLSILHNHFYSGHGMSIGSETNGGVRNVLVEDLSMDGTTSGLRIKSDISRGGLVEHVVYRDVCLRDVRAPIDIATRYNPKASGSLIPIYRDIEFDRVHSLTPGRVIMEGYDEQHPVSAVVRELVIDGKPAMQMQYARLSRGSEPTGDAPAQINPPGVRGVDCGARFPPFPETPARDNRPQLSAAQAQTYALAEVMKYSGKDGADTRDAWNPLADPLVTPTMPAADYTVDQHAQADGKRVFNTVQAAVSRAVSDSAALAGRKPRLVIVVRPGVYRELVYLPASAIPITLIGSDPDASRTRITADLDAAVSGADYVARFGPQFAAVDPAIRAMFDSLKDKPTLSTFGTAVLWVRNHGFQAKNLSVENAFRRARGDAGSDCEASGCGKLGVDPQAAVVHHQAVALMVEGADKAQFENLRLLGFQDTLFLRSSEPGLVARSYFHNAYVEGDVDFIFGDTTAYFDACEIKQLGGRGTSYVGAPNTNVRSKYGFVFDRCRFTSDGSPDAQAGRFYLARQWFHNERCTPYGTIPVEGYRCVLGAVSEYRAPAGTITRQVLETVGKMVVMNSVIGRQINRSHPWSDWNRDGTLPYRPAQLNSDDYWSGLRGAHIDPQRDLGYGAQPAPAEVYLAEYNNTLE